jgi:hypothetical protein
MPLGLRECSSCGSRFEFSFADKGEPGVPDLSERLRGLAGADAAGVFPEGNVAQVEELVFDQPVGARASASNSITPR